jgi:cold shock CspA family protein
MSTRLNFRLTHYLVEGQKVSFEVERDPKRGKTSAVNIKAL